MHEDSAEREGGLGGPDLKQSREDSTVDVNSALVDLGLCTALGTDS